jgi:hypothetical protein
MADALRMEKKTAAGLRRVPPFTELIPPATLTGAYIRFKQSR